MLTRFPAASIIDLTHDIWCWAGGGGLLAVAAFGYVPAGEPCTSP